MLRADEVNPRMLADGVYQVQRRPTGDGKRVANALPGQKVGNVIGKLHAFNAPTTRLPASQPRVGNRRSFHSLVISMSAQFELVQVATQLIG